RVFKFIAGAGVPGPFGSCGGTAQAGFQLNDQGVGLGPITIPFRLGVPRHPLVEDFEEGPPPLLPPGWISAASGVGSPWETTTNSPSNLPDLGEDEFPAPPVYNTSLVVPDSAGFGLSFLISPPFKIATPQAQLYFRESFIVSNKFDGGIL